MSHNRTGIISLENFTVPKVKVSPSSVKHCPKVVPRKQLTRNYVGRAITQTLESNHRVETQTPDAATPRPPKTQPISDSELCGAKVSERSHHGHSEPYFDGENFRRRPGNGSIDRNLPDNRARFSNGEMEKIIRAKRENLHALNNFYGVTGVFAKKAPEKIVKPGLGTRPVPPRLPPVDFGVRKTPASKPIGSQKATPSFGRDLPHHTKSTSYSKSPVHKTQANDTEASPDEGRMERESPETSPVNFRSFGSRESPDFPKEFPKMKKEVNFPLVDPTKRHKDLGNTHIDGKEVIKVLGQGSFSTIYLVKCGVTGQYQALKLFKSRSDDIDNEFAILSSLDHPHIIKAFGITNDAVLRRRVLVMEFANGRTLREIQTLNNPQIFPEDVTVRLFHQILEGVAYMHGQGVAHCDLKMENVIFSAELSQIKIIDFGFARREAQRADNMFCGSMGYMSPQLLRKGKYCMFKSDVWALGIILFKMLFNFFPFRGKNEMEILMRIERNSISLPSNIRASSGMMKFLHYLLNPKEAARPTAAQALECFLATFK